MRALFYVSALLLVACGSNAPKPAGTATAPAEISAATRSSFAAATAAMRAQQWREAETQLQQIARAQPQLSGAHLNLALLYAQTDRNSDAEAEFKQAIAVNADNLQARDQYGIWLRTQGRFKDAETIYLQTLQRQSAHADTHLNLGVLYDLYLGRPAQALEHYQQYLALKGEDEQATRVKSWVADLERRKAGG